MILKLSSKEQIYCYEIIQFEWNSKTQTLIYFDEGQQELNLKDEIEFNDVKFDKIEITDGSNILFIYQRN